MDQNNIKLKNILKHPYPTGVKFLFVKSSLWVPECVYVFLRRHIDKKCCVCVCVCVETNGRQANAKAHEALDHLESFS